MPLIAQLAMRQHGWRAGWLAIGAVTLLIGFLPVWLFMVRRPEDLGLIPDRRPAGNAADAAAKAARADYAEPSFSRRQALGTSAFWLLLLYTVLVYPVQAGVSLHQAAHLIERGIEPTVAATIVSTFSLTSAVASIACGLLPRRMPIRYPLALIGGFLAAGTLAMVRISSTRQGYVAAGLFGFGIGGDSDIAADRLGRLFRPGQFRRDPRHRSVGASDRAGGGPAPLRRAARLDGQLPPSAAMLCRLILPERGVGSGSAPSENHDYATEKRILKGALSRLDRSAPGWSGPQLVKP